MLRPRHRVFQFEVVDSNIDAIFSPSSTFGLDFPVVTDTTFSLPDVDIVSGISGIDLADVTSFQLALIVTPSVGGPLEAIEIQAFGGNDTFGLGSPVGTVSLFAEATTTDGTRLASDQFFTAEGPSGFSPFPLLTLPISPAISEPLLLQISGELTATGSNSGGGAVTSVTDLTVTAIPVPEASSITLLALAGGAVGTNTLVRRGKAWCIG